MYTHTYQEWGSRVFGDFVSFPMKQSEMVWHVSTNENETSSIRFQFY